MTVLKTIHVIAALMSISGFIVRGIWMLMDSLWLQKKWVKVVPHIIDTVLLVSAIIMAIKIQQYPIAHGWLTAKIVGLLAYIMLGMTALRFAKTKPVKTLAFLSAIIVFIYIVLVARTKNPVLFF